MEPTEAAGDRRRELADELRGIALALISHDLDPQGVERALEHARALRAHLGGARRPRWYEFDTANPSLGPGSEAFGDQSPLRGRLNPVAPPLETERVEGADGAVRIVGRARLGELYEGPPHGVHGGFVAALFDELLGAVMGTAPPVGVTAKLEVTYRNITPLDRELRFEGWIQEDRGRRVLARATCHAGDALTAEARAHFLRVDFSEVRARMRPAE